MQHNRVNSLAYGSRPATFRWPRPVGSGMPVEVQNALPGVHVRVWIGPLLLMCLVPLACTESKEPPPAAEPAEEKVASPPAAAPDWAPVMVINQKYNGGGWLDESRWAMEYAGGRLRKMSDERRVADGWQRGEWFSFDYDDQGRLRRTGRGNEGLHAGKAEYTVDYTWDGQDRLQTHDERVLSPSPSGCSLKLDSACRAAYDKYARLDFHYDDKQRLVRIERSRFATEDEPWRRRMVFAYGDTGELTVIHHWRYKSDGSLEASARDIFAYDDQGRAMSVTRRYASTEVASGWRAANRTTWSWHDNHRVQGQFREHFDDGYWAPIEKMALSYDADGRIDEVVNSVFVEKKWHLSRRHDYVHTSDGDASAFVAFRPKPLEAIRELMIWAYGEVHPGHAP